MKNQNTRTTIFVDRQLLNDAHAAYIIKNKKVVSKIKAIDMILKEFLEKK